MALAIRMSRAGRKKRPFYRIVVADKRMPRDGRFIETLGSYNPLIDSDNDNRVKFKEERVQYWLDQGAEPSTRVARLLAQKGLRDHPGYNETPKKSAPKAKAQERERERQEKLEAQRQAEEEARAAAAAEEKAPADDNVAETADQAQPADEAQENAEQGEAAEPAQAEDEGEANAESDEQQNS